MQTQNSRIHFLIEYLLKEENKNAPDLISLSLEEKMNMYRSLVNVRPSKKVSSEFIDIEASFLQEYNATRGITNYKDLTPIQEHIYLWQGDITTLACDAIVNAANSTLLGCFIPCHACIDNFIHTFSGVNLRLACAEIMKEQASRGIMEEPTASAQITDAFNLPCKKVIHTVGPIVHGTLTNTHKVLLKKCYNSCLELAVNNNIESIAFCCISTGVFCFPNKEASEIAVQAVHDFHQKQDTQIDVIFNVFKDEDKELYKNLLS